MNTVQELKEAFATAKGNTIAARREYNKTWRKDPTAKNYPAVDKALAALQEAERAEDLAATLYANARKLYGADR